MEKQVKREIKRERIAAAREVAVAAVAAGHEALSKIGVHVPGDWDAAAVGNALAKVAAGETLTRASQLALLTFAAEMTEQLAIEITERGAGSTYQAQLIAEVVHRLDTYATKQVADTVYNVFEIVLGPGLMRDLRNVASDTKGDGTWRESEQRTVELAQLDQIHDRLMRMGSAVDPDLWGPVPISPTMTGVFTAISEIEGRALRLRDVERELRVEKEHVARLNGALAASVEAHTAAEQRAMTAQSRLQHAEIARDTALLDAENAKLALATEQRRAREFARALIASTTVIDTLGSMASQDPVFDEPIHAVAQIAPIASNELAEDEG